MKYNIKSLLSSIIVLISVNVFGQVEAKDIVILVDLSNRIAYENQIERDLLIIDEICASFTERQKKQMFIKSKDRLIIKPIRQIFGGSEVNWKDQENLTIDMSQGQIPGMGMGKPALETRIESLKNTLKSLYQESLPNAKKNVTAGADIWYDLEKNLPSIKRIGITCELIILTDGYIYFEAQARKTMKSRSYMLPNEFQSLRGKDDWEMRFKTNDYGISEISSDLHDVNVTCLEFGSNSDVWNESDILKLYWSNWLNGTVANLKFNFQSKPIQNTLNSIHSLMN